MFIDARRLFRLARPPNDQRQRREIKRLDQIIERAQTHRFDRAVDAALGGHHDDAAVGGKFFSLQQLGAASVGQIHVQQHEIETQVREEPPGGLQRVGARNVGAPLLQMRADLLPEKRLILHNQDAQAGECGFVHTVLSVEQLSSWPGALPKCDRPGSWKSSSFARC